MPASGDLLEARGLTKTFGGLRAVDDLSFTVRTGEILGLLGPNGSGKTTVFNLIAGALPPERGVVFFEGREITGLAPHRRAALGIARTFQLVRTLPGLTVLDNVLVARLYGRARAAGARAARAEALECLGFVGLAGLAARPAGHLTLADRKRLEVGRALAAGPRLLLLDEPAAGLNPTEVAGLLALLRKIRAGGITIAIVEHNVGAMRDLCDRVVILNAGRKIAEGVPDETLEHAGVIEIYLGAP
ncbi:MAG TPA: ATP-binding cassette domain-containing protein [bacterium]|nr:ATP-binding cassette domain-containing protein [bacterium]